MNQDSRGDLQARLSNQANRFRDWARDYLATNTVYGEWECDYPDWTATYDVVEQYLGDVDLHGASASALTDLL